MAAILSEQSHPKSMNVNVKPKATLPLTAGSHENRCQKLSKDKDMVHSTVELIIIKNLLYPVLTSQLRNKNWVSVGKSPQLYKF